MCVCARVRVRVCARAVPRPSVQCAAVLCAHVCYRWEMLVWRLDSACGWCARMCARANMCLCMCVRVLRRATAGHMPSKFDPEAYDEMPAKPSSSRQRAAAKTPRVGTCACAFCMRTCSAPTQPRGGEEGGLRTCSNMGSGYGLVCVRMSTPKRALDLGGRCAPAPSCAPICVCMHAPTWTRGGWGRACIITIADCG